MLFAKKMSVALIGCILLISGCEPPKPKMMDNQEIPCSVHRVDIPTSPDFKPSLYITLPDACPVPDGTTLDKQTGIIYLNTPNYVPREGENQKKKYPALLAQFDRDANFKILLNYEEIIPHPVSGEVGPMGMDLGPDGNLYVCDNQFFCSDGDKGPGSVSSRVLRVEMKDGVPTGKIDVVVDGLKLANALVWENGICYVTDTQIKAASDSSDEVFGEGGIWRFTAEELTKATAAIQVDPTVKGGVAADPRLTIILPCKKIGRGDNSGLDGATWAWGALYVGNFGDGVMFRVEFDENGKASATTVLDDPSVHCCDGIFYDDVTDKIYINDSQANAIRTLDKNHKHGWLWMNDDCTGDGGLLDQPAECIVRDGILYVVNFDWPFPGLKNTANDKPHSISAITLPVSETPAPASESVPPTDISEEIVDAVIIEELPPSEAPAPAPEPPAPETPSETPAPAPEPQAPATPPETPAPAPETP
ncbi:MAG: hypothetical protein Q4C96_11610, partial [Planctomycetia bacterium]|nr:hypothetical protein [Planctomycetia bacterium]